MTNLFRGVQTTNQSMYNVKMIEHDNNNIQVAKKQTIPWLWIRLDGMVSPGSFQISRAFRILVILVRSRDSKNIKNHNFLIFLVFCMVHFGDIDIIDHFGWFNHRWIADGNHDPPCWIADPLSQAALLDGNIIDMHDKIIILQ